jgi:hypothetical protein
LETLIASKSVSKKAMTNQTQTYGSDRRSDKTSADSLQCQGERNHWKCRLKCNEERCKADGDDTEGNQSASGSDDIEKLTTRKLTQQSGDSTNAQSESDSLLGPTSFTEEKGHEGSKASQSGCYEKVEDIKGSQTPSRR